MSDVEAQLHSELYAVLSPSPARLQEHGEKCLDAPEMTRNTSVDNEIWVYWYLL